MMYFPQDKIEGMVQRAKRKLLIAPTISTAGPGSTLGGRIGAFSQINPNRSRDRKQSEREGSQLVLTMPPSANHVRGAVGMSGGMPTSGYAQQQQNARQQQIEMNQQIVKQIQNEDAANRMTSDEANARALELRNFFGR